MNVVPAGADGETRPVTEAGGAASGSVRECIRERLLDLFVAAGEVEASSTIVPVSSCVADGDRQAERVAVSLERIVDVATADAVSDVLDVPLVPEADRVRLDLMVSLSASTIVADPSARLSLAVSRPVSVFISPLELDDRDGMTAVPESDIEAEPEAW